MSDNKPITINDNIFCIDEDGDNYSDCDLCNNQWVWSPHFLKIGAIRLVVATGKHGFHARMEGLKHRNLEDVDKNICNSIVRFQNEIFHFGLECCDEYEHSGNRQFAAHGVDNKHIHCNPFKRLESLKSKYKPNQHAKMTSGLGLIFSSLHQDDSKLTCLSTHLIHNQ